MEKETSVLQGFMKYIQKVYEIGEDFIRYEVNWRGHEKKQDHVKQI